MIKALLHHQAAQASGSCQGLLHVSTAEYNLFDVSEALALPVLPISALTHTAESGLVRMELGLAPKKQTAFHRGFSRE